MLSLCICINISETFSNFTQTYLRYCHCAIRMRKVTNRNAVCYKISQSLMLGKSVHVFESEFIDSDH